MNNLIKVALFYCFSLFTTTCLANPGQVVALEGYDVVSYFTKGKAEKGSDKYSHLYKGANYYFSSEDQKSMFVKSPEKYLPQYDGYCAYGVTFGKKLDASPEAWKIVDGKLYLNLSKKYLADWSQEIKKNIREGDDQWELIKDIAPSDL